MKRKKVLIIDDDLSCLDVMQLVVSGLGFETYTFPTWKSETIQEIINIRPDVIILDEWLIGVKGSDLCVILKSINQLRRVPVILVSGTEGLAEIARRSQADGFVEKPFDIAEIEEIVLRF
ncbi:response regulator [Pedobacter sp. SYSU D00535]|uniref:response regulator n=1 Tax=Pedobacter sp. SYSU D00535 TaxID=2810308 RepID=UPI001A967813|nr:response regulator [Pedobacter sp. SYSU D00535]